MPVRSYTESETNAPASSDCLSIVRCVTDTGSGRLTSADTNPDKPTERPGFFIGKEDEVDGVRVAGDNGQAADKPESEAAEEEYQRLRCPQTVRDRGDDNDGDQRHRERLRQRLPLAVPRAG